MRVRRVRAGARALGGTICNVQSELRHARRLSDDRRSWLRWSADILAYRALRVVRVPGHDRVRTIRIGGGAELAYRLNRGDVLTLREVWIDEVYRLPEPCDAASLVDLGANIGLTSVWFAKRHGCSHVVAVEPLPANVALLRRNLESNAINATILQAAVGPAAGEALFAPALDLNSGRLGAGCLPVEVVSMPAVLATLGADGRADVLKIDIEGAEAELFAGELAWLAGVETVLLELHPEVADGASLVSAIQRAGLVVHASSVPSSPSPGDVTCFRRAPADP